MTSSYLQILYNASSVDAETVPVNALLFIIKDAFH